MLTDWFGTLFSNPADMGVKPPFCEPKKLYTTIISAPDTYLKSTRTTYYERRCRIRRFRPCQTPSSRPRLQSDSAPSLPADCSSAVSRTEPV